jgi:hypothetical protein
MFDVFGKVLYVYGAYTKTMSEVVPVRIPRELAEKVKKLVDMGIFPNRSFLVREALRRLVVSEGVAAEKLFQDGYCKDAVSRAYYAMYHAARAALSIVNVFPKTHEGVVAEFGKNSC